MTSTTSKRDSKIVSFLKKGVGIVTTRAHAHYVVSEFWCCLPLWKKMRKRPKALIIISHHHRETLKKEAF